LYIDVFQGIWYRVPSPGKGTKQCIPQIYEVRTGLWCNQSNKMIFSRDAQRFSLGEGDKNVFVELVVFPLVL